MRQLFVYYRVRSADTPGVLTAVSGLQTDLRQRHPGLLTQLLRRPEEQDGCQTWMEAYAVTSAEPSPEDTQPQGITPALQAQIEASAAVLAPLLAGARHVEVFESLTAASTPDDPVS